MKDITVKLRTRKEVNASNDWAAKNTSWSDNEIIMHDTFQSVVSNLIDEGFTKEEIKFGFNEALADMV